MTSNWLRTIRSRLLLSVRIAALLVVTGALVTGISLDALAQAPTADLFKALRYRYVGPPGNRTATIVGMPHSFDLYAGMPSGGVFKSQDGGDHWSPIFDEQDVSSIG